MIPVLSSEHSGVLCPLAGKDRAVFPGVLRKISIFFHEVASYPINNRGVLALEVPQKTEPPQEKGQLYWILLQQEIAQAVQCHRQQEGINWKSHQVGLKLQCLSHPGCRVHCQD